MKKRVILSDRITFGERVRRLRLERGWTQEELALRIGTKAGYINRLEAGKIAEPGLESVLKLAKAFDRTVSGFLGESEVVDVEAAIDGSDIQEDAKRAMILLYRSVRKQS